jgi:hypothetical protein
LGKLRPEQLECRGNHLGARITFLSIVRINAELLATIALWTVDETLYHLLTCTFDLIMVPIGTGDENVLTPVLVLLQTRDWVMENQ